MSISDIASDFRISMRSWRDALPFIRKHKLWTGFQKYKIVYYLLIGLGLAMGLQFFWFFRRLISFRVDNSGQASLASFESIKGFVADTYSLLTIGAYKYIVLIVLELFIFHIALRTIEKLQGTQFKLGVKEFIHAQVRMIKIVFISYVLESIFSALVGIPLGLVGINFLKPIAILLIQCFFFGFALIDNYHEITGTGIRQSLRMTWREYFGAATGIGAVMYLLILVPIVGTLLAPLLGSVAATLTMHRLTSSGDEQDAILPLEEGDLI